MGEPTHITVTGADEHNLQHVDVSVPRNALVVFTGVSGSGKSSLVFDTIHQEGQRRFLESLSSYARQFLGTMERPRVESVEGVSPTVCIDQKTVNRNPRSTVGTVTELYDHLRLMMARLGTPRCPRCLTPVSRLTIDDVVDELLAAHPEAQVTVLGPVVRDRKGEYRKELEDLARDGWVRARVDGEIVKLDAPVSLARYEKHTIEVVVDRLRLVQAERGRLSEAVEAAVRMGEGGVVTVLLEASELTYATARACAKHPDVSIPELEPRLFSFNAPQGACGSCGGLGVHASFDLHRLIDLDAPADRCFRAFNDEGRLPFAHLDRDVLARVVKQLGGPPKKPLRAWPEALRERLLNGDASLLYTVEVDREGGRRETLQRPWRGLVGTVERVWKYTAYKGLERFRTSRPCPDCGGARLNPIARAVDFRGKAITELSAMTVADARAFFTALRLSASEAKIGELLLQEIRDRLDFLENVGLGYLSLDRSAATLSGGEAQRIRLAAQVGSALQGVTYVLDEPSIGLHPRDNARLLDTMRRLRDRGNTVLVVEHDADTIRAADWVVDVGPGAGRLGGQITASGPPSRFLKSGCLTARYLRGEERIALPRERRAGSGQALVVRGATANNLVGVDAAFPLGTFTVVTGVSGSGKSSLVFEVLEAAVEAALGGHALPEACAGVEGLEHVDKIVRISQSPIGRTPRSNPATYTGAFDAVRDLFAATPEARARGYKKGRFSFNVAGGRCEECEGAGVKTVEMQFLPNVDVPCDSCAGRRFNAETLEVTYKGRTIRDVLEMPIGEAADFFRNVPKLARMLSTLVSVGLDYVSLGQPSTTLSGGEAQRVKLATELQRPATGRTLYLLDEPTTGLHFADVARLLAALQALVDAGNTVIVVEHDPDVVKCADWILDLGPEGGAAGGRIVGAGTPEAVAALDTPTGRALRALPELGGVAVAAEPAPRYRAARGDARALEITGARKHNLRGVDVRIPHDRMTVITGASGSGKTSLAFDTIFSEGQRRYVESLSTYARRFLGRNERAPLDRIEGLAPAIAIDQNNTSNNPRSTVATVTEVHDVLRLLWARVGVAHCPQCEAVVEGFSPSRAALRLRSASTGWLVTRLRPAEHPEERRDALVRDGWARLLEGGKELPLASAGAVAAIARGAVLVVDRLNPAKEPAARVTEAVTSAYGLGDGRGWFHERGGAVIALSERPECPEHGVVHAGEITPRHFSANARLGACPACEGLGRARQLVPELLFPRQELGFWAALDGRVASVLSRSPRTRALLDRVFAAVGLDGEAPVSGWSKRQWRAVLEGMEDPLDITWSRSWGTSVSSIDESRAWGGLVALLRSWTSQLSWLTAESACRRCEGGRLRPELAAVRMCGWRLADYARLTVEDALAAAGAWRFEGEASAIADRPRTELLRRLSFLRDVGLGYLALDRAADTLSGGESQRIRLASQLGSGLVGVIYVLDEPTIGLHPRDTDRLLATLEGLRDLGNTVVIVEHDPDTIRRADHVIDLGPEAGAYGGEVVASGTPGEIAANPRSPTGRWLSGAERVPVRAAARPPRAWLTVDAPRVNNLRVERVRFPTGVWAAISGVSGSGKSSLVMDALVPLLRGDAGAPGRLTLGEAVDRLVVVDQQPIGRTPRSTPATYTTVMDGLRKIYAETAAAKARGWGAGRFSFNAADGRCGACEGRGAVLVEMHFLPDVWVECEACRGRRFNRETLEVRWKGHSIADVLSLRVDEVAELFRNHRGLHRQLQALVDVGLGYLTLGQPGTTLSGGEAQRVKLAAELTSRKGHCVYVLDEPTTGLHMSDVARLVGVLHRLVDLGHTVITIEHNLDMLRQADWIVDMGPEGGAAGGTVVVEGPPGVVAVAGTHTGRALDPGRAA